MPLYQVLLPAANQRDAIRLTVKAGSWLDALTAGSQRYGTPRDQTDLMVAIEETDTIEVTVVQTGARFRIVKLDGDDLEDEDGSTIPDEPAEVVSAETLANHYAAPTAEPESDDGQTERRRRPTITRPVTAPRPWSRDFDGLRGGLLMRCGDVARSARRPEQVIYDFLDLALDYVRCESGSVLLRELGRDTLWFPAARGPKSRSVLDLHLPAQLGIAGFTTTHAVALAINDVTNDQRFYAQISRKLRYDTQSIICAPIADEGLCFGCIELINKQHESAFTETELAVLRHIGSEIAVYLRRQLLIR